MVRFQNFTLTLKIYVIFGVTFVITKCQTSLLALGLRVLKALHTVQWMLVAGALRNVNIKEEKDETKDSDF